MKPKKLLAKLVEDGCLMMHMPTGTLHTVATARLDPGSVWWCVMFAEDQHHTHRVRFNRLVEHHGRDLGFYVGGRMEAYCAPYNEWPEVNPAAYLEERSRWKEYLQDRAQAAHFEQFVRATAAS
jgi:hypothetical protein